MKKLFTTLCLLFVLPLGLVGCASNSNNSGSHTSSSTQSAKSNSASTSEASSNTTSSKRAVKVRYENVNLTTTLDHEYQEERLYKDVPGTVDHNKIYHWDNLNVSTKTKVYVDKKAVATFKDDDDNEYEHEDFYRIKLGTKQSNQQYWVNDDVLQHDHDNDYDD